MAPTPRMHAAAREMRIAVFSAGDATARYSRWAGSGVLRIGIFFGLLLAGWLFMWPTWCCGVPSRRVFGLHEYGEPIEDRMPKFASGFDVISVRSLRAA